MSSVSTLLNIYGESQVEIVFNDPSIFEAAKVHLQKTIEPKVRAYIESLNIPERLKEVTALDVLEKTEVNFMPNALREALATEIDSLTTASDVQKTWLFTHFLFTFYEASVHAVQKIFAKRAQEIANSSRIIKP